MSSYPNPNANLTIFNNTNFNWAYDNLTYFKGDKRYLKLIGSSNVTGNLVLSGNLAVANNYVTVANGAVMIGTVNPTSTGASCPLLVQPSTTSNNPWLNGIVCYGNLTANAVICASVQNAGLNCWFALANRFGNSWVIANDNGTNSGNPLRFQASQDFSNVNANMMSLSRTGNLWVNRAIGIGTVTPTAPLHITTGTSGTDPSTNGIYLYNSSLLSGNNAIITARTNGSSAGSPSISLDINNVGGWNIKNDNAQGSCLNFNNTWDGSGTNFFTILRTTGNVGIASTNPTHKLAVYGTVGVFPTNSTGTERIRYYTDATGTADIIQIRQTIGSSSSYWYYNGNNVSGTVSDRRVKCRIEDLNMSDSIMFIKNLRPRKFNYKSNPDGDVMVGFIAQEVLESCITEEHKSTIANYETYCDDDPTCPSIGLNQTQLQPMMIHTIQSLLSTVETLESRIKQLEDTNARLNSIFGGHYI